jgi:hypothetical protein
MIQQYHSLRICPRECKSGYNNDNCTHIFIAALFTIAKLWKQLKCHTTDELIKEMWYLYTMKFYSAIRKNEILLFAGKCMELNYIILCYENKRLYVSLHM